ncbi:LOW QUALITY PROTEIN: nucleolar complex protein 3 homolog [Pollicipes pollicipes]|uniref:LOW QUALITY PROTEIN: nucleolar complex protein 3 homolog n=1 Tax=Pollicipes pollicipes TaxID=41117 RepID=UPI0018856A61|nr:LOW QUALITY PROTEIN: nucleolar complex protein 3 homolog [Pollicipes pollicipes]
MMKKKPKKQAVTKSKKPSAMGKGRKHKVAGGGRPNPVQKSGPQKPKARPPASVDNDMDERHQRIRDLRRSLGMSVPSAGRTRADSGDEPAAENGPARIDTEGLEHLIKAAKRGRMSLIEDAADETEAAGKRKRDAVPSDASRRKRKPAHSDDEDSSDADVEMAYEKTPRAFPVVRDLLPIKTKKGVVKRKMLVQKEEETAEQEQEQEEEATALAGPPADGVRSVAELFAERRSKIDAAKLRIGSAVARAPGGAPGEGESAVGWRGLATGFWLGPGVPRQRVRLGRLTTTCTVLLDLLSESDPAVMVTVRKYAAASLLEVFKDLLPSYRLQEHDMTERLKKDTIAVYKYENGLVNGYKKYLIKLEEYTKALSSDQAPLKGLAVFCLDCLCQCLVRFRDFNFASNLVAALVPHTSHRDAAVRAAVCAALRTVFADDRIAERSLEIVRKISQLIKAKHYDCRRDITDLFLALRIRNVNLDKERQDDIKAKKFMTYKEKLKNMSRKERKRSKKLEALERELLATKAEENKQDKVKRHTEILTIVFTVYFKILKQMPRSALMASVLEGLAKFAHMINVDFFHDLVESFHGLLASHCLASTREVLLCVQTVFTMLSGQGEAINIDPQRFYGHCYRALSSVRLDDASDELAIALASLDVMLIRRRKKISPQRVLALTKRLASVALRAPHPAAAALLMLNQERRHVSVHSSTGRLLDTESVASGLYRPDVDDPEYCGAGNTLLYELTLLRRSYHQPVRTLAAHVMLGCPVQGDFALSVTLRQQSATEVLDTYDTKEMRFTPAVTPPSIVKKRTKKTKQQRDAESGWLVSQLEAAETVVLDTRLDFAKHLLAS